MANQAKPEKVIPEVLGNVLTLPELGVALPAMDIGAFRTCSAYVLSAVNAIWTNPWHAAITLTMLTKKPEFRANMASALRGGDDAQIMAYGAYVLECLVEFMGGTRQMIVTHAKRPTALISQPDWMVSPVDRDEPVWGTDEDDAPLTLEQIVAQSVEAETA